MSQHHVAAVVSLIFGVAAHFQFWPMAFAPDVMEVGSLSGYALTIFIASLGGMLLGMMFPNQIVSCWLWLMMPSLIFRHAALLWRGGDNNLWPPLLGMDVAVCATVLFWIWLGSRLRLMGRKSNDRH